MLLCLSMMPCQDRRKERGRNHIQVLCHRWLSVSVESPGCARHVLEVRLLSAGKAVAMNVASLP